MNYWNLLENEQPLAKPHQTYRQHVQRVLEAHLELWPQTQDFWSHLGNLLIAQGLFAGNLPAFLKRIDAGLRLACATHDLGKLNQGFHLYMCAERDGKPINRDWHFRHELLSLPFTASLAQRLSKELGPLPHDLPWETVAVMGHHKRLDITLFERERTRHFKPAYAMLAPAQLQHHAWNWLSTFLTAEMKSCRDLPLKFWEEGCRLIQLGGAGRFIEQKDKLRESLQNSSSTEARFLLRCFGASFKAHLQICDWWASAHHREIYGLGKLPASPIQPADPPQTWLKQKLQACKPDRAGKPTSISWRDFQQQVAALGDYACCIAPTGSGKTEAALLWALNRLRHRPHLSKILYLLPTTTTANAIHQRLGALFGKAHVGLAHSKARLLRDDPEGEAEEDDGEVRQDLLFEAAFFPALTVATLDQLLLAGLHGKYWVFRNHALAQSAVILDELHAFDPYTLGLLGAFARQLRLLHVPVLALSATFPQPLRQLFESWFPETQVVQDHSLLAEARGQWQFRDDTDFSERAYLRKIARQMRQGERFLLVRNTVRGAQETFECLREFGAPVRLLHSAFMQKDRRSIEKAILDAENSGSKTSLVATQIVEVSLDIDYDHLVSELCPPDAMVQRAGRCNRARKKNHATITVLAADEISHKVYQEKFGIPKILDRSAATLGQRLRAPASMSEQNLLDWVNEVYAATDLACHPHYQQAERDFHQQQHRLGYVLDHGADDEKLETRWIKEERVPVIPQNVWDGFSKQEQREFFKRPNLRAQYSIEIPFWRRKLLHSQGNAMPLEFEGKKLEFFYWVDLPYDVEMGLQLPKPAQENLKHTEIF